jgi:hypothetical protein
MEEIDIYLGNKGRWDHSEKYNIFLNLKFKQRPISSSKAIVSAEYSLKLTESNTKYWVINFIMCSNKHYIREFLEKFGRIMLITDNEYIELGLYYQCQFQNLLPGEQEDRDEIFDYYRKELIKKIEDDDVCILEDEDLSISETGTSLKTKMDFKEFRYNRKITDFEVCYIFNLIKYVIGL